MGIHDADIRRARFVHRGMKATMHDAVDRKYHGKDHDTEVLRDGIQTACAHRYVSYRRHCTLFHTLGDGLFTEPQMSIERDTQDVGWEV